MTRLVRKYRGKRKITHTKAKKSSREKSNKVVIPKGKKLKYGLFRIKIS